MAPTPRSQPAAQPAATPRTRPEQVMKVPVLNIGGPFTQTTRPVNVQPATSRVPVERPQHPVAHKPVTSSKESKQLAFSIQTGSSTRHQRGHSSGLCPWCLAVVSKSAMMECLNIRSLQLIKKTVPDKHRRRGAI